MRDEQKMTYFDKEMKAHLSEAEKNMMLNAQINTNSTFTSKDLHAKLH